MGIEDGERIEIGNNRGEVVIKEVINEGKKRGVVV